MGLFFETPCSLGLKFVFLGLFFFLLVYRSHYRAATTDCCRRPERGGAYW